MIETNVEPAIAPGQAKPVAVAQAEPLVEQAELRSADIIPFRPRPAAPRPDAHPSALAPAQERIARALEMLNAAMAEQRTAMALWRTSLAALKDSTAGLGGSLQRYHTNLTSLSQSVTALRTQAKSLQAWAEKTGSQQ